MQNEEKIIFKSKYFYIWIFFYTFAPKFVVRIYVCMRVRTKG